MIDLSARFTPEQNKARRDRAALVARADHRFWQSLYKRSDETAHPRQRFWATLCEWWRYPLADEKALAKWAELTSRKR